MLFSSYIFLFLFLPVTLFGFFVLGGRERRELAIGWLVAASLFFYAWWKPVYLAIIVGSMLFSFAVGRLIIRTEGGHQRMALGLGIVSNLLLLGYYKYAEFFLETLNTAFGSGWTVAPIMLPLAISFFTFQQIAFLVDCHRGQSGDYSLVHYCLFVTFFPQLIAGPIVHHREMMPQFARRDGFRIDYSNLAAGYTLFTFGLFKKVVLADGLAPFANPVFAAAERGVPLSGVEAWGGALAYTFQLYFDFSGYSDMAIGLARMFGIRLPQNFHSPYRARNVVDFWRRWHITLSRFLRDHVYIPLGGNRAGETRRYTNVFLTMLLGGLWHGAGWTFVAWGALHGLYLMINHAWARTTDRSLGWFSWPLTFLAVVAGWVLFRAESFSGAASVLRAMVLRNGIGWSEYSTNRLLEWDDAFAFIGLTAAITWFLPNTMQLMRDHGPAVDPVEPPASGDPGRYLRHKFTWGWCLLTGILFAYATIRIAKGGDFLYFNF